MVCVVVRSSYQITVIRNQQVVCSSHITSSRIKGHLQSRCPFILGSAAQRAAPHFGISMLGAARFSPAAKTLVRRTCAAVQKGRLAVLLQRSRPSKISILTVPSYKGTSAGCPFCLLLLRTGCRQQIKSVSAGEFPQTRFWIQGVYSKTAPEVSTLWPQRLSMSVPLPENTEPSK